jgi:hypothetical protein
MTTGDLKLVLITGDLQIRSNGNGPKNVEKRMFPWPILPRLTLNGPSAQPGRPMQSVVGTANLLSFQVRVGGCSR